MGKCLVKLEKESYTHETETKRIPLESFSSGPCKSKAKLGEGTLEDPCLLTLLVHHLAYLLYVLHLPCFLPPPTYFPSEFFFSFPDLPTFLDVPDSPALLMIALFKILMAGDGKCQIA